MIVSYTLCNIRRTPFLAPVALSLNLAPPRYRAAYRTSMTALATQPTLRFPHRDLLGIEGLSADEITMLLDLAESYVEQNRQADKKSSILRGRTVINLFFENSTRTRTSFELAGKRLGGRPPNEARRFHASFSYQAQIWKMPHRVVAKVEWYEVDPAVMPNLRR